jgi:hypothetical protein
MSEGQERQSTQMPWPLRMWPLTIIVGVATTALVLLAVLVPSEVTRVALPAIAGAIGTIGLAVVTVRLSISERAHQDQLRRAEAEHQQAIKAAEERAASERESELKLADAVRQARRVAAFSVGRHGDKADNVTVVNGSDYPIFDIRLIGARVEPLGESVSHTEWPPEVRLEGGLEGEFLGVAVLLPSESTVFWGLWQWRKGYVIQANKFVRRPTYTWTDDQGRAWRRDGSEPPALLSKPLVWTEFWGDAEYVDPPEK